MAVDQRPINRQNRRLILVMPKVNLVRYRIFVGVLLWAWGTYLQRLDRQDMMLARFQISHGGLCVLVSMFGVLDW